MGHDILKARFVKAWFVTHRLSLPPRVWGVVWRRAAGLGPGSEGLVRNTPSLSLPPCVWRGVELGAWFRRPGSSRLARNAPSPPPPPPCVAWRRAGGVRFLHNAWFPTPGSSTHAPSPPPPRVWRGVEAVGRSFFWGGRTAAWAAAGAAQTRERPAGNDSDARRADGK